MCGIAGFTTPPTNSEHAREVLSAMLVQLAHRGPEGARASLHGDVALGHCALGFVAIGTNPQPRVSRSGSSAIVFNGEVYNRGDLARDLRLPSSSTDTELIVELYERDGLAFAAKLRGMFAVAIHDFPLRRTVLVRDHFGKKPLYYWHGSKGLIFASELRAVLVHPDCPRELDEASLALYLRLNAVIAPHTLVRGVRKIRPGHLVVCRDTALTETCYWRPPAQEESRLFDLQVWGERLEHTLQTAIRQRLASSDLPLGTFLSGGLDSGMVTALAQRASTRPVDAFSVGFGDPSFDESEHAALVARHTGARHHTVRVSRGDLAAVVQEHYGAIDEPIADPALAPGLILARHAAEHVKGVLTGDGADELFLGYRFFQAVALLDPLERWIPRSAVAAMFRLADALPVRHSNLPAALATRLLGRGAGSAADHRWYESTSAFRESELQSILDRDALNRAGDYQPYGELRQFVEQAGGVRADAVTRARLGMICHYLRDVILTRLDRATMRHGIEARCPFLDVELVNLTAAMPLRVKMKRLQTKVVLKHLARHYLPPQIVRRTKQGFRAPVAAMLCGELRSYMIDLLSPAALKAQGLFCGAEVQRLVCEHLRSSADHQKPLWSLICFQAWYAGAFRVEPVGVAAVPEVGVHAS